MPDAAFAAKGALQPKKRKTLMRKIALLSASALVLVLGVASASAEPHYNGVLTQDQTAQSGGYLAVPTLREGRAAAFEGQGIAPVITEKNSVR
jgi:hypothetical protein